MSGPIETALATRQIAPNCSACGQVEPRCDKGARACVCSTCTNKAVEGYQPDPADIRACPDCGANLPGRAKVCQRCTKLRRRAAYRNARKASRMPQDGRTDTEPTSGRLDGISATSPVLEPLA